MIDPWETLANAVILQAVNDYRAARDKLRRRPKSEDAKLAVRDCEAFFRSKWYQTLTELDGELLIRKLREEWE